MPEQVRQEKIEYVPVELARESLAGDVQALGNAAVILSCDSRITDHDETGRLLRRTRDRLLQLKALLVAAERAFDRKREETT